MAYLASEIKGITSALQEAAISADSWMGASEINLSDRYEKFKLAGSGGPSPYMDEHEQAMRVWAELDEQVKAIDGRSSGARKLIVANARSCEGIVGVA